MSESKNKYELVTKIHIERLLKDVYRLSAEDYDSSSKDITINILRAFGNAAINLLAKAFALMYTFETVKTDDPTFTQFMDEATEILKREVFRHTKNLIETAEADDTIIPEHETLQ